MKRRAALLLGLTALGGCSLEPRYERPRPAVPPSFPDAGADPLPGERDLPTLSYRDVFRDPKLQAIIARALADSQDVRIVLANLASARALYRVQRAELLPAIDGSARVSVSDGSSGSGSTTTTATGTTTGTGTTGTGTGTGLDTGTGTIGTGTGTTTGTISAGNGTNTVYSINVGLSAFEIDLFGRVRSLTNAALQEYLATEAAVHTARLSLVGEIASAYFTLATDRSLLKIAVDTEASAAKSVMLTRARLTGGIAPRSDLRQAETVLAQARSDHADLTAVVAQDRNALELLVGAPVPDAELPTAIEQVDGLVSEVPAGLDSRILLRRPDVVEAEYRLRAQNARIGAARANFFPRISLTALAGFASTALLSLFSGGAFTWSVQPSATLPIFDGGANRGNLAYARAQRDLTLAQYQQAIQTAFREVADAFARRGTIGRQLAAQTELEAAARDNYVLADARYREGIDTFLTSLDAQRTLYSARRTLASTRLIRADNLVTLYRTLGGDELIDIVPPRQGAATLPR